MRKWCSSYTLPCVPPKAPSSKFNCTILKTTKEYSCSYEEEFCVISILLAPVVRALRLSKKKKKKNKKKKEKQKEEKKKTKLKSSWGRLLLECAFRADPKLALHTAQFPLPYGRLCLLVFHFIQKWSATFCCTTAYKQPPPFLHRRHYHAVWYIRGYCILR